MRYLKLTNRVTRQIGAMVFLTFITSICLWQPGFSQPWEIMTVDSTDVTILGFPVTIDHFNRPHIAYRSGVCSLPSRYLKHASWDGYTWNNETADSSALYPSGYKPAMALSGYDVPVIVHTTFSMEFYTTLIDSSWITEIIPNLAWDVGEAQDIALDAEDNPHIAIVTVGFGDLWYTTKNLSGEWTSTFIYYASTWGQVSIALDTIDKPHIVYAHGGTNIIHFNGAEWTLDTVMLGNENLRYAFPSIDIDSINFPHVCFTVRHPMDSTGLYYASWNGTAWDIEIVDSLGTYGWTSLSLDSDDHPHIAYKSTQGVMYAHWNGYFWEKTIVDTGSHVHLALNKANLPFITYRQNLNSLFLVKCATMADIHHYPAVQVLYPNGGGDFVVGDTCEINWIAIDSNEVDSISILYSTNSGINWDTIATGEPNDSTYEWIIPNTPSDSCLVKILAYNPCLNMGEDQSDSFFSISSAGIEENISSPKSFILFQVSPNPFKQKTVITFSRGHSAEGIELKIFDVTGRLVKEFLLPTTYSLVPTVISWDGRDDSGNEVQSGVYFCRFVAGDYQSTKKLLRLR